MQSSGPQPQLAIAARNGGHDGSPELDFVGYHPPRQRWSGFFCLPTWAGFRGVRGGVPRLWVLEELVSIRSVFPRSTLRDIVSKHAVTQGSGVPCLWVPSGIALSTRPKKPYSCSDTVRRRKHFTRVPLGIQAFDTPESAVNPELRVRPSTVTAGVRGDCAMGPLRCRRQERRVRCEANVSLRIRPGNQQHADGKLSIGEGAGAGARSESLQRRPAIS